MCGFFWISKKLLHPHWPQVKVGHSPMTCQWINSNWALTCHLTPFLLVSSQLADCDQSIIRTSASTLIVVPPYKASDIVTQWVSLRSAYNLHHNEAYFTLLVVCVSNVVDVNLKFTPELVCTTSLVWEEAEHTKISEIYINPCLQLSLYWFDRVGHGEHNGTSSMMISRVILFWLFYWHMIDCI